MTADVEDQGERERLRVENALLRAQLTATEAENRTLLAAVSARSRAELVGVRYRARPVEIGSRERMAMLEHTVDVLDTLARSIAHWECYSDEGEACTCAVCSAEFALKSLKSWRVGGSMELPSRRFEGAMYRRIEAGWDPRETKIHRAWATFTARYASDPDRLLALILTDRPGSGLGVIFEPPLDWPSARDWYVATSVVQWLATTVGSSILETAGWKYTQHDEDRAMREAKRAAADSPFAQVVTAKQEDGNADHR